MIGAFNRFHGRMALLQALADPWDAGVSCHPAGRELDVVQRPVSSPPKRTS